MFGKQQLEFLNKKNYLGGLSLDDRISEMGRVVGNYESDYYEGLQERIEYYIKEQILSPSTPQWANLGRKVEGTTPLPASCFIINPENSIKGIYYSLGETAMMSKLGGGVGIDYTNLYDGGTFLEKDNFYTNSKLDWIEDGVRTAQKVSQGSARRGYSVPFISIDDKEFNEVMDRASKKNPDKSDPLVSNNIGVILPSGFDERIKTDKELKKRYLRVLKERLETGKTYLLHVDNCNKNQSPVYKNLGHSVESTNICTEVLTPKYDDKSFVCVIASLNLKHWDRIKADPQIIKDCYAYLDINVSEFIRLTEGIPFMEKARRSAIEKRDIGLGTLGLHSYFQSKGASYGGIQSRFLNKEIYKTIRQCGEDYTLEMGEKLGSPAMCVEAGLVRRNVSLGIVAPNKSTAFLCDASAGREVRRSNYYVMELAGIQTTFRNPDLMKLLESKGENTKEVWGSILVNLGSVQHLDILTDEEKSIYRTFDEVSPKDILDLAADAQVHIDMAQSINLCNRPNYTMKDIYEIHKYAWSINVKTLYYYYPQGHAAIEKNGAAWDTCESCAD
jgi:ribonucleoside-diphosphate reductase alpha chain